MLPNLPDELFNMFIAPLNNGTRNVHDSQPEGRWHYHFGGLSIKEFSDLGWEIKVIFLNKNLLHPDSYRDINGLVSYCASDNKALFPWYPQNSPERLVWHKEFVLKTGHLCAPIVGIKTGGTIRILDGTHRLSALFSLGVQYCTPVDIWIGE